MSKKKDTFQVNIRPSRKLMARLDDLARLHERESGNQVAVEILDKYTEFWALAEQAKKDTVQRQQEALHRAIQSEMLKLPIRQATTESRTQAQGKKGRR